MNFRFIGDVFFPPACLACGDRIPAGAVCTACLTSIELSRTLFCGTCMARLPDGKKICHKDAPYLLGAAADYNDGAVAALVHGLKFQGIAAAAEPLASLLVRYVRHIDLDPRASVVVPLPLSLRRARARGFNQSALIAHRFADALVLPIEERALARVIHRKPQSDTESIIERLENVRGVFAPGPGADAIAGKRVILIDDVVTSGTTFTEAAKVLKALGAKKIFALAVAKA